MTAVSATARAVAAPRLYATSGPLWLALAVTAIITVTRIGGTVDSDVAWQLWIAGRMHAGAHLYRDIIEVNPPLWFWMALPIDSAASFFHLPPEAVLVGAMGTVAAIALIATDRLLPAMAATRRSLFLAYAALILMGLPWVHIGQREQIVLITTLPYAALIACRRDGRVVAPQSAVLIGAGAALGFALKHYFLIVPAALELWLLTGQRRPWRWHRPEIIAIVVTGLLYGFAMLVWAPEYLRDVVPLVRLAYDNVGAPSLEYLFGPFALLGLVILAAESLTLIQAKGEDIGVAQALIVAAAAFALVYFVQSKGWIYHAIPLLGCSSIALLALLTQSRDDLRVVRLSAPALLILPFLLTVEEQLHPALPNADLEQALSGTHAGDTVGFLTVETAIPWSVTLQHGLRYPSRYMGFWMLNAVVRNEQLRNPDPRLAMLGRQIVGETVDDFLCTPPGTIIVARPRLGERGFDILLFFHRDARFTRLLSHYRVNSRTSLETYELASPLPPPIGPCRRGV